MAVSSNAILGITSTVNYGHVPRTGIGASIFRANHFLSHSRMFVLNRPIKIKNRRPCLLVVNVDRLATETNEKSSQNTERSISNDQSSASSETEPVKKTPEPTNGSMVASDPTLDAANADIKSTPKRSRLTAREKLKAARVLSRHCESKPAKKPQLGSKVLEALRESDKITGKKGTGLPEAPTNLFDDSKRGMPKKGLTFELPVGWDVFLIILSVVLISTIMFTTTFIVWKVGAIHFNEY